MNGEHILHRQARGLRGRVDHLLSLYTFACVIFFLTALLLCATLMSRDSVPAAVTLFVLSTAITGHAYSTVLQRRQQIRETTDRTIDALRSRWDELRKDSDLLGSFATLETPVEQDPLVRYKIRLFASTVLDMYALIIHYIHHGYFQHSKRFASIYESMIKSLFRHGHMRAVWREKNTWGSGCLKDEYGESLTYVVMKVLEELEEESANATRSQ